MTDEDTLTVWRNPRSEAEREAVVDFWRPVVQQVVRRFPNVRSADREDLLSVALIALCRALDDFDAGRGYALRNFIQTKARYACVDAIRKSGFVPKGVREDSKRLETATDELIATNAGRYPSHEELAAHLGMDLDALYDLQSRCHGTNWTVMSLDAPIATARGESFIADDVPDVDGETPEKATANSEQLEALRDVLSRLSTREQEVIRLCIIEGREQRDVAREWGVHESRCSQVLAGALSRARVLARQRRLVLPGMEAVA